MIAENQLRGVGEIDSENGHGGLYILQQGTIPDNSRITSFCVFGSIKNDSYRGNSSANTVGGRLTIFVVRNNSDGEMEVTNPRNVITLVQDIASAKEVCINTSINVNSGNRVSIFIAVPSSCVEENGTVFCPLQVNLGENMENSMFYSGSETTVDDFFASKNSSIITNRLNSGNETLESSWINVEVSIEGMCIRF